MDSSGTITTIAGFVAIGGDGGPATDARLAAPTGVAVDGAGNLYIADQAKPPDPQGGLLGDDHHHRGHRARAGSGGDGGPAVEAQLDYPVGMAVDGAGNLYIADTRNHRIRKVDSSGTHHYRRSPPSRARESLGLAGTAARRPMPG